MQSRLVNFSKGYDLPFWFLFLLMAASAAFAFGIAGIGRGGELFQPGFDSKFTYIAGHAWRDGVNAYDPVQAVQYAPELATADRYDFAYLPNVAPLALLLSSFSFAQSNYVLLLLNMLALAVLCAVLCEFLCHYTQTGPRDNMRGCIFIVAIVLGNPFTAHVLWMGQTTLLAAAALAATWHFQLQQRPIVAGLCLAIAGLKPQLSILFGLWFLLDKQWKLIASAALATLLFCALPLAVSGFPGLVYDWLAGVSNYKSQPFNVAGFQHLVGLQNLLLALGVKVPNLLALAVVLTVVLKRYQSRFDDRDIPAILMGITLVFGFSHDYDLVALVFILPCLWYYGLRSLGTSITSVVLMLGLFFPQRVLRPLDIEFLLHYRTLVMIALLVIVIVCSWRAMQSKRSNAAPTP